MMSKIRKLKRSIRAILNIAARTHKWGRRGRSGSPERVRPSPPVPARQPSQGVGVCPRRPQSVVRLPLRAIVSQRLASRPALWAGAWKLCMQRDGGLAGTTQFRSEKACNWQGGYRVPAFGRWPGRAPFCRHDAQRPGGVRMLDGHAAHGCRYAGCQKAADERRHLRREKISRPSAWLQHARRPERQDQGSKGAFWRSVWPVRVYRSTISRPRRRTDSARQRVRLRHRSRRDRSSASGSTRPCARRPWLDLETDHIASPAFITNGRDHPPGVKRRRRTPQTHPPACLNAEA